MKLKFTRFLISMALLAMPLVSFSAQPKRLLLVTATRGFRHSSIPIATKVITRLGQESGAFTVDLVTGGPNGRGTEGFDKMSPENLKNYDGAIFVSTTGTLPIPNRRAFIRWIRSGKAFIGMHAAADTFDHPAHVFPGYTRMLGAQFRTHHTQATVHCIVEDPTFPGLADLGHTWTVHDEIYLFWPWSFHLNRVHQLLWLDQHPNTGQPGEFPVAWCKRFGRGRVFYISLGHRRDVWDPNWTYGNGNRENPPAVAQAYQKVILGGIKWALGLEPGSAKPQSTVYHVSADEAAEGFKPLFDGTDLDGWRLRNPDKPSWSVQNGMLVNTASHHGQGSDLVTDQKYWNFTARYEYMIPKGSNSGFYLRGRHEVQILDDGDATEPSRTSNGSIYNYAAPSQEVSKKPGHWQTVEATIIGHKVTVILNGVKIIDNLTVDRPTGGQLDNNIDEPGSIFLQGDHGAVAFRDMRIKILP